MAGLPEEVLLELSWHWIFLVSALFAAGAAVLGAALLRGGTGSAVDAHDESAPERPAPPAATEVITPRYGS